MDGYLLDTNILRYWYDDRCKEHKPVISHVRVLPDATPLWISAITRGEIEYGHKCNPNPDADVQQEYLAFVEEHLPLVKPVDKHAASYYGELRAKLFREFAPKTLRNRWPEEMIDPTTGKELGIQENDIWIAAQALEFSFVLVSNDKQLGRISEVVPDLRVENWAKDEG